MLPPPRPDEPDTAEDPTSSGDPGSARVSFDAAALEASRDLEAEAVGNGTAVRTGTRVEIWSDSGLQRVRLPILLIGATELLSAYDPAGIAFESRGLGEGGALVLHLGGEELGLVMTIETGPFTAQGTAVEAEVKAVHVRIGPVRVGAREAIFGDAVISMQGTTVPDSLHFEFVSIPGARLGLVELPVLGLDPDTLRVVDIGIAFEVSYALAGGDLDIPEMTLFLDGNWAKGHGLENLRLVAARHDAHSLEVVGDAELETLDSGQPLFRIPACARFERYGVVAIGTNVPEAFPLSGSTADGEKPFTTAESGGTPAPASGGRTSPPGPPAEGLGDSDGASPEARALAGDTGGAPGAIPLAGLVLGIVGGVLVLAGAAVIVVRRRT